MRTVRPSFRHAHVLLVLVGLVALAGCTGKTGDQGPLGPEGPTGPVGPPGAPAVTAGSIAGTVRDGNGGPLAGASIATVPPSKTATSAADGSFTLSDLAIGSYSVAASRSGYTTFTLPNVGVVVSGTTNVSLVLQLDAGAPGAISGTVTDSKKPAPTPLAGVVVSVQGSSLSATTNASGAFTLSNVPPGPVFLSAAAPSTSFLDTETMQAVAVTAGATTSGVKLVLSARPRDSATYAGAGSSTACVICHASQAAGLHESAHYRSLTRIARTPALTGPANAAAFTRLLNPPLSSARVVMVPLSGTISIAAASTSVAGSGTTFTTDLVAGDVLGYTPAGLGWTALGTVAAIADDTHLTLAANATFAPTVTSISGTKYGSVARSRTFASPRMWPSDATDIVAPAWPGVKATNPNYDPNDPRIYGFPVLAGTITATASSPTVTGSGTNFTADFVAGDSIGTTAASSGSWSKLGTILSVDSATQVTLTANAASTATAKTYGKNGYSDGLVNVYLCNLKGSTVQGVSYVNDEYVQKFGGLPYSCADGTFWDGVTTPAVPLVHTDVIYGGQGDKDGTMASHPNMGVFKQRYQGRLSDIKAAGAWAYTTGKSLDSLTLPIQVLESGDKVNGGFKMNGYHPTEQKFPGESWTQRTRTFSHACAGCHNTGLSIDWDPVTVTLPFGRDGAPNGSPMTFSAIKSYSFLDENITCEQCHGPASEHVAAGGGAGRSIINPRYLTANAQRQLCGKCHAYDDATNANPGQDYGFEYPWDSNNTGRLGGGEFVAGAYDLTTFFDNWAERLVDDEALWDPAATGGRLYGQAHRQQFIMLGQSVHTNNPYLKATCADCHDHHTQYLGSTNVQSHAGDAFSFAGADFRNDVLCLSCHAEGGPLSIMPAAGPFAAISKEDVANLHFAAGGAATRNGTAVAPTEEEVYASQLKVSQTVSQHMFAKANMVALYDPANEARPVGRCTSCHMPKLAKSGGYVTDVDSKGNKVILQGDQASHAFDIVWPWDSNALSRGGPTFQSGYYAQFVSSTNVKYDLFGYMPNSCDSCHENARRASLACPDTSSVWPSFWPFSEHRSDAYWSTCYTTSTAP